MDYAIKEAKPTTVKLLLTHGAQVRIQESELAQIFTFSTYARSYKENVQAIIDFLKNKNIY